LITPSTNTGPDIKPNTSKLSKRLYNLDEAAHYLGRSKWAIREMLWAGKMPFVKDGKRILVDIQDMDRWIDKSKIRNTY
jgi:excisionase family DNA binding protein